VSAEGRAKKKEKGSERGRGVSERANSCWEKYLRVRVNLFTSSLLFLVSLFKLFYVLLRYVLLP
jgi:hypothetical protein